MLQMIRSGSAEGAAYPSRPLPAPPPPDSVGMPPACRATGDPDYLQDAKAFFGAYQSSKEAEQSLNLLVDWNNNYWSTAVLLASITDLDAYHYQAQDFLGKWVCSTSNVITYTKQGRAWNINKGACYCHAA